ncbi:MAG: HAD family hydrolase [Promethearchaeota archaeon]
MGAKDYLKGIKLIIFDYDGVLYNMIEPLRSTVIEGTEKFQLQSNGLNEDMREVFRVLEFALSRTVADQILDSKEMLDIKLLDGFAHLKRLRIATFFYGDFRERTTEPLLFDGVIDLIKKLHDRGIKMAILSNSAKKYIKKTLETYDLQKYFSIILGAAEVIKVKPDPEGLFKILEKEGISAKETLFIGDMISDTDAGKNAGIKTIAVASGILPREKLVAAKPHALVDNIRELLALFQLT